MKSVLVINGPNLNLLGSREVAIYGTTTLTDLESLLTTWGSRHGVEVTCYQSNHEGDIIERLHDGRHVHDGVILNAGALTHYSYAIHDAIVASGLPTVEVHISNVMQREGWRRHSVLEPACVHTIYGRGIDGYRFALEHLVNRATGIVQSISYGPDADQVGDLRVPPGPGPHPVAVMLHGGFWRDPWTRDVMDGIALDITARGWATWNLEYHRVGGGGGWPITLQDVATGIDHLAKLAAEHRLDLNRVVSVGHSAGGHLALWAAARPRLTDDFFSKAAVLVSGVIGLAPVSDLDRAKTLGLGDGAVIEFLGGSSTDQTARSRIASPALLLPLGVPQEIVHGTGDDAVPVALSRYYTAAARAAGDKITLHELADVDHMSLIDPTTDAWATAITALERLTYRTRH